MSLDVADVRETIRKARRELRDAAPGLDETFAEVEREARRAIA
jgi:hypothetical protein